MTITHDFDQINNNYNKTEIALRYRKTFKSTYLRLKKLDAEISTVVTGQSFAKVPKNVRNTLKDCWNLVKEFNSAVESNNNIMEMFNWKE